jgi:hypothetical protein
LCNKERNNNNLKTHKMTTYNLANGNTIEIPTVGENSKGGEFSIVHKLWESGEKKRVYIKAKFQDGGYVDCGFVDLVTGKEFLKSAPVWIANNISNEIN